MAKKKTRAEKQFDVDINTWKERIDKVIDLIDNVGVRTRRVTRKGSDGQKVDAEIKRHRISFKTLKLYLKDKTVVLPEIDKAGKKALVDYAGESKKIKITTANYTVQHPKSVDDLNSMIDRESKNRNQALYFQPYNTELYGNRSSGKNEIGIDDMDTDNEPDTDDESTDESTDDE